MNRADIQRLPLALAVVSATLVITGCSSSTAASTSATPSQTEQQTESAPSPDEEGADAPAGLVDDDTGETITPQVVPEWNDESRASVIAAAESATHAFARPDLAYEDWWAGLQPLLTQQASSDYAYVDPANIPASEVTGSGTIVDESSAYVGTVEVPTDVGDYLVILNRKSAEAEWMVSRITPPEDLN